MTKSIPSHPAYCGFDCAACPIYIATMSGDKAAIAALIAKYSTENHRLTEDEISCHGCKSEIPSGHKFCAECEFRHCANARNIASCGECSNYPCQSIEHRFPVGCESRKILDGIHTKVCILQ